MKKKVVVVGPMSSGCRLLRNILELCPDIKCRLDTTHGTMTPAQENGSRIAHESIPIVIFREETATRSSQEAVWAGRPEHVPYDKSITGIKSRYPNAFWVKYEDVCEDVDREIGRIARYLRVNPWKYKGPKIENRNGKWYT